VKPLLGKRRALLLVSLLLFPYISLAGYPPSLLRAYIMYFTYSLVVFFGYKPKNLNILVFSFIIQGMIDPSSLLTLGAKLSFSALGGIILLSPLFFSTFRILFPRFLRAGVASSLGAQTATLPLVAASFGVYYPIGILAGLVLSFAILIFIWTGLLGLVFLNLPPLKDLFSRLLLLIYRGILLSAEKFSRFPALEISVRSGILLSLAIWVFCLGLTLRRFLNILPRLNKEQVSEGDDKLRFSQGA